MRIEEPIMPQNKESEVIDHMKIIKTLYNGDSKIDLVEIGKRQLILKTAEPRDIYNEKKFAGELANHKIDTLEYIEDSTLKKNQLLMEYIEGSPTLNDNPSDENIYNWGALISRIHHIKYNEVFEITAGNRKKKRSWKDFIKERIGIANIKLEKNDFNLDLRQMEKVKTALLNFQIDEPQDISLIHCDLNKYNILLKNGKQIIFDKGSQIFSGDYLFDLATVKMGLTDSQFSTFLDGYGKKFNKSEAKLLDYYHLLRAIMRFPNPRPGYLKEVVEQM